MGPLENNPSALSFPRSDAVRRAEDELARTEALLVEAELRVATLRQKLAIFERQYHRAAAALCEQLDALNARIAELCVDRIDIHEPSQSSQPPREHDAPQEPPETTEEDREFVPSESLRKLYRDAAKLFHPDLAEDDDDREWRTQMMQQVNAAYAAADCAKLSELLTRGARQTAATVGDTTLATLEKKINRVRARLDEILREEASLEGSDLGQLYSEAHSSGYEQATFFQTLVIALKTEIHEKRELLKDLMEKGKPA